VAVGVSLGAAFNAIIASLVNDVLFPIVGALLGSVDFKTLSVTVGNAVIAYG
jgi:large conductance mechanosensitive channel